jgi:hypothetical protein
MLGDADGFRRSIDRSRQALDRSPVDLVHPGIFSFVPEKLAFYEARGWVELARPDPMRKAASPTTETTAWTAGAVPA